MNSHADDHKRYLRGTHRACTPEETFERCSVYMGDCGITRIADITGLDSIGLPVYIAIRPNSRALSTSQGKGMTAMAAKVSALMESMESWHAERAVINGVYDRRAEAEQLTGVAAVPAENLVRRGESAQWAEHTRIAWSKGRDLIKDEDRLVPYDCVSMDFTDHSELAPLVRTSNGLASGNTLIEAQLHAIYELVERDAVARWINRGTKWEKTLDLGKLDEDNHNLVAQLDDAGLVAAVRVVPSRFDVPVFSAVVAPHPQKLNPPHAAFSGFGAHLDPVVAVSRALTEAVQSRLAFISGSRDDLWPSEYSRVMDPTVSAYWSTQVMKAEPDTDITQFSDSSTDSFQGDLDNLLASFRGTVENLVAVNLTRDEVGIPVSKIVATGFYGLPFESRRRFGIDNPEIEDS